MRRQTRNGTRRQYIDARKDEGGLLEEVIAMTGYIYIAGSFLNVNRSRCGQGGEWIDNDPHFWTDPPTWGICRPDLREKVVEGDVVFFVLPLASRHPQMIFAYMTVRENTTHVEAFSRLELQSKRMGPHVPNGNILVDEKGRYNRYDLDAHRDNFERISKHYVIGDSYSSRLLGDRQIRALAPTFIETLSSILKKPGARAIDIVSRYGTTLSIEQVVKLTDWLNQIGDRR